MTDKDETLQLVVHELALQSCIAMLSTLGDAVRERWLAFPDEVVRVAKAGGTDDATAERARGVAARLIAALDPPSRGPG